MNVVKRHIIHIVYYFLVLNVTSRDGGLYSNKYGTVASASVTRSTTQKLPAPTKRILKVHKVPQMKKDETSSTFSTVTIDPTSDIDQDQDINNRTDIAKFSNETQIIKEVNGNFQAVLGNNHSVFTDKTFLNFSKYWMRYSDFGKPTCEPVRLLPTLSERETGYFMISSCQFTSDAQLRQNCSRMYSIYSDYSDVIPVYNRKTLTTYRNIYCALCNNISQTAIEFWKPFLKCGDDFYRDIQSYFDYSFEETINKNESNIACNIKFEAPEDKNLSLTSCKIEFSRFNATGYSIFSDATGFAEVLSQENTGVSESFSFSGLLRINSQSMTSLTGIHFEENDDWKSIKSSKSLVCNPLSNLQNGKCIEKFEYISSDIIYIINIRIKSDKTKIKIKEVFNNKVALVEAVEHVVKDVFNFNDSNNLICERALFLKSKALARSDMLYIYESTFDHGEVELKVKSSGRHVIQNIADAVQNIHNEAINIMVDNQISVFILTAKDFFQLPRSMTESSSDQLNQDDNGFSIMEDIESSFQGLKDFLFQDRDNFTVVQVYKSNVASCILEYKRGKLRTFKTLHYTSCPKLNLSLSEDSVQIVDNDLFISGQLVDVNQYYFEGPENILICASSLQNMTGNVNTVPDTINVELILSIVCISLSLLCLCISFFIYCYLEDLRRSVPGKNTLALITTLLISQIMFLVGSFGSFRTFSFSCIVVGMLVHFSWLFALFYMNVCTFHMFKTLTALRVVSNSSGFKTCVFYFIYVFSLSLFFVLVNIVISFAVSDSVGYGETYCYISSQLRIMLTVGIPAIFVILTNVCMYFAVIVKMKRSPSMIKNVKRERNDLLIFAKLSTITGVTWIFGLLYAWTNLKGFSYVFILLNASQGVFLMIAFVANRRVFEHLKDVCSNKKMINSFTIKTS